MVTQRQNKREGNWKQLFVSTPAKRQEHTVGGVSEDNRPNADEQVKEDTTPIIRSYLEHLFSGLCGDIAILRQEISATSTGLQREVAGLGQRMDPVERLDAQVEDLDRYRQERLDAQVEDLDRYRQERLDAQVEDLDRYRQERLTLQESNRELQYQLDDLENRLWRSNICTRGVPKKTTPGPLEDFVQRLFQHVAPALKDQEIIQDHTHRVGFRSQAPGQAQDKLTCLHYYKQREQTVV
ncbi:hypothetical protein NDU88_000555 [Pleurodeles waltl]|uniref:Uncharacterized protein n=1 Tax=Pleurodeles waltl TaxID=8319 RepID=A0AAV7RAC7_PLEWA|nr:hypothetical protein NDU88_000555 [Pleurodeles waltl]